MKNYGLIGYTLSHSFSENYFKKKFTDLALDATYRNFEIADLNELKSLVRANKLDGFNVTIPYKEKVVKYVDEVYGAANEIGAVNCVKVRDGKLIGYNTDIIGFEKSLRLFLSTALNENDADHDKINTNYLAPLKALVFGNGGASKAVTYVLNKMGIDYLLVSRNDLKDAITYGDLTKAIFDEYKLLINTTPVGMYPDIDHKLPLPYHMIDESHFAFDLIYNPEKTIFLTYCEAEGAAIKNGYEMLVIQAEESYKIFTED